MFIHYFLIFQPISWELPVGELHCRGVQQCLPHVHLLHRQREVQRECPSLGGKKCSTSFKFRLIKLLRRPYLYELFQYCTFTVSTVTIQIDGFQQHRFIFWMACIRCSRRSPAISHSSSNVWWKLYWRVMRLASLWRNKPCCLSSWTTVSTVWCVPLHWYSNVTLGMLWVLLVAPMRMFVFMSIPRFLGVINCVLITIFTWFKVRWFL